VISATSTPWAVMIVSLAVFVSADARAFAQTDWEPADPFAAIEGHPIYLGELNLILSERLNVRDLDRVDPQVKRATAAFLVRRHLAMKSLQEAGGAALQAMLARHIDAFATEAKRRGSSVEDQAKRRGANVAALTADLQWRFAWNQYLKSKLTDANLERFFEQNQERYAGSRWKVSQIFLGMEGESREVIENTRQTLGQLAAELREQSDVAEAFARAARDQSDAADAKADGGMVGWVESDGDLPFNVMQAVRETPPGQIGGPIRSSLGLHLIYVHDKQAGDLTFQQLTDQALLRRDASDFLFRTLVQKQAGTKVDWFVPALQPPDDVDLFE